MVKDTSVAEKPATNQVDTAGSADIRRNTINHNPLTDDPEDDDPDFLYAWIMPT